MDLFFLVSVWSNDGHDTASCSDNATWYFVTYSTLLFLKLLLILSISPASISSWLFFLGLYHGETSFYLFRSIIWISE